MEHETIEPECIWPVGAELGEGPIWQADENAVYFVDIKQRHVHRYAVSSGERRTWSAPSEPGFIVPAADGGFVCGLRDGLYRFNPANGTFRKMLDVEPGLAGNRLNDGFVDRDGYLWFGSMDNGETAPTGTLYRLGADGTAEPRDEGYAITNGPATSPDGRTLYHVDTVKREIYAFDLHESGRLANKRLFVRIAGTGNPDGLAVDSLGYVWIALFAGARIERYAPDGRLAGAVAFPCPNITKLVFAGDDLRTVYATTATLRMTQEARARAPHAGGLFRFQAPVAGLAGTPLAHGLA